LLKVHGGPKAWGPRQGALSIMVPEIPGSLVRPHADAASVAVMGCRSQFPVGYCYGLKNLAFPVEPPASLIRPTLRDGH